MKKYIFNIMLSLLFLGCPLDRTSNPDTTSNVQNTEPKAKEIKPYDFEISCKSGMNLAVENLSDATENKICVKEENSFITVSSANSALFKVSSSRRDEFKKAMLDGSNSFNCTDISGDGNDKGEKIIKIERKDNKGKKYIIFLAKKDDQQTGLEQEASQYIIELEKLQAEFNKYK